MNISRLTHNSVNDTRYISDFIIAIYEGFVKVLVVFSDKLTYLIVGIVFDYNVTAIEDSPDTAEFQI